jgi:hypothetical protein
MPPVPQKRSKERRRALCSRLKDERKKKGTAAEPPTPITFDVRNYTVCQNTAHKTNEPQFYVMHFNFTNVAPNVCDAV